MKTKNQILPGWCFPLVAAVLLLALLAGSFLDCSMDAFLYTPDSLWALCLYVYGPAPCFWCLCTAAFLLFSCPYSSSFKKVLFWLLGTVMVAGSFAYVLISSLETFAWSRPFLVLAAAIVVLGPSWLFFRALGDQDPGQIRALVWFLVCFSMGQFLIVQILKNIWLRPRFVAVTSGYGIPFQPWWIWSSSLQENFPELFASQFDWFRSFPSAHTASAACIFALCLLPACNGRYAKYRTTLFGFCLLVCLTVMVSRMVLGAHYLSDVSAGFLISWLLFWAGSRWFEKHYPFPFR